MKNSTKKALLVGALWLGCAIHNYGAALGWYQGSFPAVAQEGCRGDMGFSAEMGLVAGPVGTLVLPFLTGFYEYGFKWACTTPIEGPAT